MLLSYRWTYWRERPARHSGNRSAAGWVYRVSLRDEINFRPPGSPRRVFCRTSKWVMRADR